MRRNSRIRVRVSKAIALVLLPIALRAANLDPGTLAAWQLYLDGVKSEMEQRIHRDKTFLWVDEDPIRLARVRRGEIVVSPADDRGSKHVRSGLIHDWMGAVFIPGATLNEVFRVTRDYAIYKDIYRPSVIDSKMIASSGSEDRFSLLLENKSFFHKTALQTDYQCRYALLTARQGYGISQTTRVHEIDQYGAPDQHVLPDGEGDGLIWRLCSIMRFVERDGGVYLELQAVSLSRDIPFSLRWLVEPVIRRVARDSIATCLLQTERAVSLRLESSSEQTPVKLTVSRRCFDEDAAASQASALESG